jgi:DNA-binding GntR family transcriptional regulator
MGLLSIEHVDLGEKVYQLIRREILQRNFKAGQKLDIYRLAEQLGVSRTPVKDAVNRLASEGLVVISPRRGTFVSKLERRDVEELFDARLMIELWAAERAIERVTESDLNQLRELIEEGGQILKEDPDGPFDYEAFSRTNAELHLLIMELCGNRKLVEMYKSLHLHVQVTRAMCQKALEACRLAHGEHQEILRCYENRDLPALKEAIRNHLATTLEGSIRAVDERGGTL